MSIDVFLAGIYVVPGAIEDQKWVFLPRELKLETVISQYMGIKSRPSVRVKIDFDHQAILPVPKSQFHEEQKSITNKKMLRHQHINYLLSRTWSNASYYFYHFSKCQKATFISICS